MSGSGSKSSIRLRSIPTKRCSSGLVLRLPRNSYHPESSWSLPSRRASLLAIGAVALILLTALLPGLRRLPVIGGGLTLGGLLTLVYGLALGIQVDSNLFRFLTVTASLIVLLVAIVLKLRSGDLQGA